MLHSFEQNCQNKHEKNKFFCDKTSLNVKFTKIFINLVKNLTDVTRKFSKVFMSDR